MENIWKNCVFRTNAGYCYLNKTGLYSELVYWRGESILRAKFKLGLVEPLHDMCCAVLSHFSYVQLFATLWAVAHQAPLSMGFSRQEYWSGLPFLPPGDLPEPGIKPVSPAASALKVDSLPSEPPGLPQMHESKNGLEFINTWKGRCPLKDRVRPIKVSASWSLGFC